MHPGRPPSPVSRTRGVLLWESCYGLRPLAASTGPACPTRVRGEASPPRSNANAPGWPLTNRVPHASWPVGCARARTAPAGHTTPHCASGGQPPGLPCRRPGAGPRGRPVFLPAARRWGRPAGRLAGRPFGRPAGRPPFFCGPPRRPTKRRRSEGASMAVLTMADEATCRMPGGVRGTWRRLGLGGAPCGVPCGVPCDAP